jgi:uncharacterized membrane protein
MATRSVRGHAPILLHPGFVGAGAALLIAAFVTDYMYYTTSLMQWANFSAWLIAGGLVVALVAAIFLLIDFLLGHAGRLHLLEFIGLTIVVVLSIINVLIHSRDAWTSVVPSGITISAICAVLLLIMSFRGWSLTESRGHREGGGL